MESKLNQQQNTIISLAKSKYKTSLPEKQNTWGNLLNKKSSSNNTAINLKKKPKENSEKLDKIIKTKSTSVQCELSDAKLGQSSSSLSIFNPIRTLQFLLKEIIELPNVKNTGIINIVDEMHMVLVKIIEEYFKSSKLHVPIIDDNYMIPTRENDYSYLKYENNPQENKYWLVLLRKISELKNNYSQLTENYTKSEEKLKDVVSERDKLLEKFKELCDSLEMLNNHEREYLNTITELKAKVAASEKLICKQENIIINLKQRVNNLPNYNQELVDEKTPNEKYNTCKAVLKENHKFKQNCRNNKCNLDQLKITNNFKDKEFSKLRSDIQQIKQTVLAGLENKDVKSVSMTLKSEGNQKTNQPKFNEINKNDTKPNIDAQYMEYNQQASDLKLAKAELQQLFKTIKLQANLSKKLFNSTFVDENGLSDMSDEEDNYSNFMSIVTDSSY